MRSENLPTGLSRLQHKLDLISVDPYFRDTWDDVCESRGEPAQFIQRLNHHAPLVLRPDALGAGRAHDVLEFVYSHGFRPVAWSYFIFTRHVIRETWRYQLNIATTDRIEAMDLLLRGEQAMYILLERPMQTHEGAATTLLSRMKGPSDPALRTEQHLRFRAGAAQESVITYVHVADEPIDILREMGVFFDRSERRQLFESIEIGGDIGEQLRAEVAAHWSVERFGLDFDRAMRRLTTFADTARADDVVHTLIARINTGNGAQWRQLLDRIEQIGVPLSRWDRAALAARLSARHVDAAPVVPDITDHQKLEIPCPTVQQQSTSSPSPRESLPKPCDNSD
ncbi:nucleoside-diphosphate kinase [Nocardia suismassiliense]|uniref:nucleoside-diphosphate kinase n=1 Tax=Nocardia suismassiliense TaxID=2077092 RepID=UPI00131EDF5E|nr:nucleoside-diphosphate kinase [Nocardia suismassiliense]